MRICAPIRFPGVAVTFIPLRERLGLMAIKFLAGTLIHFKEMLYQALVIELPFLGQYPSQTDMLDMVAPITQSAEAEKRLDMGLIIICPSLVTTQPALGSTDAAHMAVLSIHLLPSYVPSSLPHCLTGVQAPHG